MQPTQRCGRTIDLGYLHDSGLELVADGVTRSALIRLVEQYNDRTVKLTPDYYGIVSISGRWFEDQQDILTRIRALIDPVLAGDQEDSYVKGQLTLLRRAVDTAGVCLANERRIRDLAESAAPKRLHFIWSGRQIRPEAKANILAWANRTRGTGWQVIVWTDPVKRDWPDRVKAEFAKHDVVLAEIAEGEMDPRLWPHYLTLVRADKPNYPAASDLARYSILSRRGGVYVDVDIAPGGLDLAGLELYTPITLLAPEIRDSQGVRDELDLPKSTKVTAEHVTRVAAVRIRKGLHNNNFIVAAAKSPVIEAIIVRVLFELKKLEEREGGTESLLEMPDNTAFVTGPAAVKRALVAYVTGIWPKLTQEDAIDLVNQALLHDLPLGWVTPESERQEH